MTTERDPDLTRRRILETAFEEIHRNGFRAASLGSILERSGISKGALYHHFRNKTELGYAIIDELIEPGSRRDWQAVWTADDPISAAIDYYRGKIECLTHDDLACGCPVNNLSQEMSPIDEGFRARLNRLLDTWTEEFAAALARGQKAGNVAAGVDCERAAAFIVAATQGCIGIGKNAQDTAVFTRCVEGLIAYLETLRPSAATRAA